MSIEIQAFTSVCVLISIMQNTMDGPNLFNGCMARASRSKAFNLHEQSSGVLRKLRYIQLYEILIELFEWRDGFGS